MSDLANLMRAHQRLILLRALAGQPGYAANDSYLQGALATYGLPASRDQVRGMLTWLAEQGAVVLVLPDGPEGSLVATARQAGIDVAAGTARMPGVHVPGPGGVAATALGVAAASVRDILGS
jgi:hypothetical protein